MTCIHRATGQKCTCSTTGRIHRIQIHKRTDLAAFPLGNRRRTMQDSIWGKNCSPVSWSQYKVGTYCLVLSTPRTTHHACVHGRAASALSHPNQYFLSYVYWISCRMAFTLALIMPVHCNRPQETCPSAVYKPEIYVVYYYIVNKDRNSQGQENMSELYMINELSQRNDSQKDASQKVLFCPALTGKVWMMA